MYNILSLVLGLMALIFAVHSIRVRFCPTCCNLSFSCCGGALLSQLLEIQQLVSIGDWSALMDTIDAVILAAASLLAATVMLNVIAALMRSLLYNLLVSLLPEKE